MQGYFSPSQHQSSSKLLKKSPMQLRATQHNCQSIPTSQDVLLKFPVLSVFILQQVLKPRHRPGNARLCFKTLLILSCHHTVNICPVRYNARLTASTYGTGSVC